MGGYGHRPEYPGATADIDVAFQDRHAAATARPNRYLLEQQAVHADDRLGMNYDPIGMWHQKPAPYVAGERDVGARHDAPEAVLEDVETSAQDRERASSVYVLLVSADGLQQLSARLPK